MLSIIIPVFNQASYTQSCLEALAKTCGNSDSFEVVLIDNCSSDNTADIIADFQKLNSIQIQYIKNQTNLGFTLASNQGAARAKGDTLVFLNNDTIPQQGWREALECALRLPGVGIVGPRLLYPHSLEVNHAGYVFNPKIGGFYSIYQDYPGDFHGVLKQRNFQALLGACLMMQRATFEKLNGFTEIGLEDIDLCLRAKELGLSVLYVPSAVVYHHGSVTQNNSKAGTIPVYGSQQFSDTWKDRGLLWDDFQYYIEDNVLTAAPSANLINSYQLVNKANFLISEAKLNEASDLLKESLSLYSGNTDALSELILLSLEQGNLLNACTFCRDLLDQAKNYGEALAFLGTIYQKLHMKIELIETIGKIDALQSCSSQTRALAKEMRRDLL